jgi:hypothetical protein
MKTIDRDLDLLVRHQVGPRLGEEHGDIVVLARPPTRVLVAVDPEKRFATRTRQRAERDKLVRRLHESLPPGLRSAQSLKEMGTLVDVTTWGAVPWEFANFTDAELAVAIMECVTLPSGMTRRDLVSALKAERAVRKTNPKNQPEKEPQRRGDLSGMAAQVPQGCPSRGTLAPPSGQSPAGCRIR